MNTVANVEVGLSGTCNESAASSVVSGAVSRVRSATAVVCGVTANCAPRKARAVVDTLNVLVIVTHATNDASNRLSTDDLVSAVESNQDTIADTVAAETGITVVVTEVKKIEEPSAVPSISTSPTTTPTQSPTVSHSPTHLYKPIS